MARPLLTDAQMNEVRNLALMGMQTPVTIYRRSEGDPPAGGDYGDDFLDFDVTLETRRRNVKGWFFSNPVPQQDADTGAVVSAVTYRLYLPVGTDVLAGDKVTVGADVYIVSDTTKEGTWLPLLTCSLRKRE